MLYFTEKEEEDTNNHLVIQGQSCLMTYNEPEGLLISSEVMEYRHVCQTSRIYQDQICLLDIPGNTCPVPHMDILTAR